MKNEKSLFWFLVKVVKKISNNFKNVKKNICPRRCVMFWNGKPCYGQLYDFLFFETWSILYSHFVMNWGLGQIQKKKYMLGLLLPLNCPVRKGFVPCTPPPGTLPPGLGYFWIEFHKSTGYRLSLQARRFRFCLGVGGQTPPPSKIKICNVFQTSENVQTTPHRHVLAISNGIANLPEYILTNSHFQLENNEIVMEY